jgi:hypothetical protein
VYVLWSVHDTAENQMNFVFQRFRHVFLFLRSLPLDNLERSDFVSTNIFRLRASNKSHANSIALFGLEFWLTSHSSRSASGGESGSEESRHPSHRFGLDVFSTAYLGVGDCVPGICRALHSLRR